MIVDVLKARLKTTGVVEHTFTFKTAEFRGMTWKVFLPALAPATLSELCVRYTTLEAPEIRDTHGLLSLTTVCFLQFASSSVLIKLVSECHHIFGSDLYV